MPGLATRNRDRLFGAHFPIGCKLFRHDRLLEPVDAVFRQHVDRIPRLPGRRSMIGIRHQAHFGTGSVACSAYDPQIFFDAETDLDLRSMEALGAVERDVVGIVFDRSTPSRLKLSGGIGLHTFAETPPSSIDTDVP